jgi:hypothetical protein
MMRHGAAVLRRVRVYNRRALESAVPLRTLAVKEEKIEVEGEVVEALPSTMFRITYRYR